jgi:hypothetical protein
MLLKNEDHPNIIQVYHRLDHSIHPKKKTQNQNKESKMIYDVEMILCGTCINGLFVLKA